MSMFTDFSKAENYLGLASLTYGSHISNTQFIGEQPVLLTGQQVCSPKQTGDCLYTDLLTLLCQKLWPSPDSFLL